MVIALLTGRFAVGGAEKVMAILANRWAAEGHEVAAISLQSTGKPPFFPFDEPVKVIELELGREGGNHFRGAVNNLSRLPVLRKVLRGIRPDVIISFMPEINIRTLLATRGLRIPVIACERTDPAGRKIGRAWEILRQTTYPWAGSVVCQGARPLSYFAKNVKGCVIPNPVVLPDGGAPARRPLGDLDGRRRLMALGSLRPEKGFDLLIEAFASIASKHPDWDLVIWGEGPDRDDLLRQTQDMSVSSRVSLPGNTAEAMERLAESDIFILSSRVEGFPNVLAEAMSVGLPVISTDVGAVPEIVRDGVDGLIVAPQDAGALANAIDRMIEDRDLRERLSRNAPSIVARFDEGRVIGMWTQLIELVSGKSMKHERFGGDLSKDNA